jgi:nucleoside-diphosphate-sugar epimerase
MSKLSQGPAFHLLCLGYGAIAKALVRTLPRPEWRVTGTTRNAQTAAVMQASGIAALDLSAAIEASALADVTHLLLSIPPDEQGDLAFMAGAAALLRAAPKLQWVGYLSTTGVYGDLQGRWVFEWTPAAPLSTEGKRRALAERQWLESGLPVHVFRLPGLYGPGRSAFDRLRAGDARRIVKSGQVFSRAHEDDVAAALLASIQRPNPGRIYNICDDEPAPPQDVTAYAAHLLGMAPPPEIALKDANLSPMAQRFYAESKRVANARAKSELGWRPLYPTYREGLAAILAGERAS